MKTRVEQLLIVLFLTVGAVAGQTQTVSTAITHVTVIDVIKGTARPDTTVLISGNRISTIGPSSEVSPPAGSQSLDGRGKFLIPGLWDMHVHLGNATEAALPML